jgi:hypothetical protein
MFVRNKTPYKAALTHGKLVEQRSIGTIVVEASYAWSGGALTFCDVPPPAVPTDPPSTTGYALWQGTSVTAAGTVHASHASPTRGLVSIAVGQVVRRLAVFGERRWFRDRSGSLRASEPRPFDALALSFALAFGGAVDVAPGLFPCTDLPFPGGRLGYSLNEGGVGFYLDEQSAEGRALPNFETAESLIQRWDDRPVPGCFAPCPDLAGLRSFGSEVAGEDPSSPNAIVSGLLRGLHHAPGYLIFEDQPPGTSIALAGIGREAIRFELPPPPVRVRLRRGASAREARARLRSVHVDADRSTVACTWGYSFIYDDGSAPSWILVES